MDKTNSKWNNVLQNAIAFALVAITLAAIFTPFANKTASFLTDQTSNLMLVMLAIGFIGLMASQKRIMIAGLACCASLCLFLKNASNDQMVLPVVNQEPSLSVAHFNVNNVQDINHFFELIRDLDVEVLSFQELTPDWKQILQDSLSSNYPHQHSLVRIDPYGMAMYSKLPYSRTDTFLSNNKPNLDAEVMIDGTPIHLVGSYIIPGHSGSLKKQTEHHLQRICQKINNKSSSVIALGDYNMVYWTNEITKFRKEAKLKHSRRDVMENRMKPPYDHIFFTEDMECTRFDQITDLQENHLGILGTYQIKSFEDDRLKPSLSSYSF